MNREQTIKLLKMLLANYPNTKIKDASATADAWEMNLGEFSAEAVYKSARLHMATSSFFPTPAEIRKNIVRAELIYSGPQIPELKAPKKAKTSASPDGVSDSEFLDTLIQDMIDRENEVEADRNDGFLSFER